MHLKEAYVLDLTNLSLWLY